MKHGRATSPDALAVRVSTKLEPPGALLLTVSNSGRWVDPTQPGTGLGNLRARLARRGSGQLSVAHEEQDGWVHVWVQLLACRGPAERGAA